GGGCGAARGPGPPPAALNMPARPGEAPAPAKTVTSFVKEAQEKAKAIPGYGFGGGVSGPGTVPTGGLPGGAFSGGSGYGMMGGGGGFNPYSLGLYRGEYEGKRLAEESKKSAGQGQADGGKAEQA